MNFHKIIVKGGESNAQTHLVLTPFVFALWLNATIFALKRAKNANSERQKSLPSAFFRGGCVNDAAPNYLFTV